MEKYQNLAIEGGGRSEGMGFWVENYGEVDLPYEIRAEPNPVVMADTRILAAAADDRFEDVANA